MMLNLKDLEFFQDLSRDDESKLSGGRLQEIDPNWCYSPIAEILFEDSELYWEVCGDRIVRLYGLDKIQEGTNRGE